MTVFFSNSKLYVQVFKQWFFWSKSRPEHFLGESIPERHYLVGNSKITRSRNGTRTILHKNAMLVVVWYSHLTWQFEFDRFLFQFKTVCTSLETMIFLVQIKTRAFFGESIPERHYLVESSKITHNRNGTRTISHENAILVVVWVFTFNLKIVIWPFSFPSETLYVKDIAMLVLSSFVRLFVFSFQRRWLPFVLSSFWEPIQSCW